MKRTIFITFLMAALVPGWTQSNWAPAGLPFAAFSVRCLYTDTVEDVLWVGGDIRDGAPNLQVLLKYDGVAWTSYGHFDNQILAITRFDNKIIIGGFFTEYNGVPCEHIAYLEGDEFVQIDEGASSSVIALASIGDTLFVGGSFDFIGSIECEMAAKYDGQNWHCLNFPASGTASVVDAFLKFDDKLFVGGNFNPFDWWDIGGALDIFYLGENSWQPAGGGIQGSISDVRSMIEYNGELIIGGAIYKSAGNAGHSIQKWNPVNQTWEELGGSLTGENFSISDFCPVKDIDIWNNKLYIWGGFINAGDIYSPYITVWDGERYCWPGGNFTGYGMGSELEFFHDTLYVACGDSVDGQFTNNLAKYVGDWEFLNCSTVGVENYNPDDDLIADISLFPNPATSIIHLRNLPSGKLFTLEIYNSIGQIITSSKNKVPIDVSTLVNGTYFLKVEWEGGQAVRSFVKE